MSNSKAKNIRKIMGYEGSDPVVKRKFKSIKKEYSSLNNQDKQKFISMVTQYSQMKCFLWLFLNPFLYIN